MLIKPKIRGFICTTSHPIGCDAQVKKQCDYIQQQTKVSGPKKVLVIGASTGYGLASRIAASFACGAATIGVFFEKPAAGKRTASAGWYNSAAFEKYAAQAGYYASSINGDAFSVDIKQQTIDKIKQDLGKVDLVVYSLATPRRTLADGESVSSSLKTLSQPYTNKSVDPLTGAMSEVTIEPATQQEIDDTVTVMGGEDWADWIQALLAADVLEEGAKTVAYSYIGPELTYPMYREGTIGKAKDHLEQTALQLQQTLSSIHGEAYVSVNKALVTQSSAAIPVVPLYVSVLFKVMKEKGIHEGCIEQIYRLFAERLYTEDNQVLLDTQGRIRIDDWEMREDVQQAVGDIWPQVSADSLDQLADLVGYRQDFYHLFGFEDEMVDYDLEVEPQVAVPSIVE